MTPPTERHYRGRMLGYIFMILALVVLLPLVLFLLRGRAPRGRGKDGFAATMERKNPAADEPTPDVTTPRDREGDSRIPPA